MTNINFSVYNSGDWGRLLQNTEEGNSVDSLHGTLIASEESFVIRVLNPKTHEVFAINIDQIIDISKKIMAQTAQVDEDGYKEINYGLKHLESQLRASVENHKFHGKDSFFEAVTFYGDSEDFLRETDQVVNKMELEPVQKKNKKSVSMNRESLVAMTREKIDSTSMLNVRSAFQENPKLLFELNDSKASFFELAWDKCSQGDLIPLLTDVLFNMQHLEPKHIAKLKEFLFQKNLAGENSFFQLLMLGDEANSIYDILLKVVTDLELNGDQNKKYQMFDYAHSTKRYNYIFFNVEDLPQNSIELANASYKRLKLPFEESIKARSTGQKTDQYRKWLERRRVSSSTLSHGDPIKIKESSLRWEKTEESRSDYAIRDRSTKPRVELERIQILHKKLCRGEDGISNPGELRTGIVRTSGGWTHFYCPKVYLDANVINFMSWFNIGLKACDEGRLNPIIFSAQTYQRFVSLHPFENGNGRISRILMDYVLERYGLPPPILGKDVLDAVFPMDQRCPNQHQFLEKIIMGIEASRQMVL